MTGKVKGPWTAAKEPLYAEDGGHGMLFRTLDGQLTLALHTPNSDHAERLKLLPVSDEGGQLTVLK